MEGELGFLSPARSSCVSSEGFGSPIWASPREGLLNSSPTSCVSDSCGNGGRLSSPTWGWGSPLEAQLDSPASCVSDGRGGGFVSPDGVSAEKVRDAERLLLAISERYDDCFLRLRDATAEVAQHRLERLRLRAENMHLSLILQDLEADQGKQASPVAPPKPVEEVAARGSAPKSISIRSKGYLSQKQLQGETEAQRLRVRAPPVMEEAAEGDGEVEVEAYSQGAEKTELCNKWERGSCSYGGRSAGVGSHTACRTCAPSSAARATRPSPARCSPPPQAAPTATAATSATPQRTPPPPTSPDTIWQLLRNASSPSS